MIAGSLEIEMRANVARLTEDMGKVRGVVGQAMTSVERSVNMAKNALGVLGIGLSVGWAINFIKNSIDATARMKDLGQEAGVTASAMSKFEAPARMAGLGLDSVAAAMFKVSKAALEARDPASASAQALAAIGISTAQLKGLKPDEMFELVARSVAKYADGLEKNNVMQQLFGKSGREMNRVVAEIADARKLSATVTDEEAEAADRLGDQLVELQMNSERAWRSIIGEGVPVLTALVNTYMDVIKGTDGMTASAKKLAAENTIRDWAVNSAIALAMAIDAIRWLGSTWSIVTTSIGAAGATIVSIFRIIDEAIRGAGQTMFAFGRIAGGAALIMSGQLVAGNALVMQGWDDLKAAGTNTAAGIAAAYKKIGLIDEARNDAMAGIVDDFQKGSVTEKLMANLAKMNDGVVKAKEHGKEFTIVTKDQAEAIKEAEKALVAYVKAAMDA
ncbi:MAG: hypothetical protein ABI790_11380, partial [Betaproteobacteria bacterium]